MSEVRLEGANRFQRDLEAAMADLGDLGGPMVQGASTILARAKATVPRLTGALAASMVPRASALTATVETRSIYANVIHWGWPAHGIEGRPWLTDSAYDTEAVWIREFEEHVQKAIKRMDKDYT